MLENDDSNTINKTLRLAAESKLQVFSEDIKNSPVYELELHKIELEMQNEELLKAQFELETLKSHYINLYEQAPIGYVTLDNKEIILQSNTYFATLMGVDKKHLNNRPLTDFIFHKDQDIYYLYRKQFNQEEHNKRCKLRLTHCNGNKILVNLTSSLLVDEIKDCRHVLMTISDISPTPKRKATNNPQLAKLISKLSKREVEVLKQVLKGFSNKEIASYLAINYRTVEQHRSRILLKTGLKKDRKFNSILQAINQKFEM